MYNHKICCKSGDFTDTNLKYGIGVAEMIPPKTLLFYIKLCLQESTKMASTAISHHKMKLNSGIKLGGRGLSFLFFCVI